MVAVTRDIPRSVAEVFEVVSDPTTYPSWLVGAREIRAVDPDWPAVGSAFHHRVGLAGPLTIADSSKVLEVAPPHVLELEVRARPLGRARASFRLTKGSADGANTHVEFDEVPLGRLRMFRAVIDPLTAVRNQRSLDRLADFITSGERAS